MNMDTEKHKDVVGTGAVDNGVNEIYEESQSSSESQTRHQNDYKEDVVGIKSPGVARIEQIVKVANIYERTILFVGIFLSSYAYGLGATIHSYMISDAAVVFGEASLQASVNVITSVVAAAALPAGAKLSDVFGRLELISLGVFFNVLGNIICAASHNMGTLSGGQVLYTVGYTLLQIMYELLIADFTSVRARVFASYIPALPFIINTWISGNVNTAFVGSNNQYLETMWRWGFGCWCIIVPVLTLPLIGILLWLQIKASRRGLLKSHPSIFKQRESTKRFLIDLFWLADVPGIILVVGVFILILYPLTLAGGYSTQWKTAKIIAPIVVGFCLIPFMVLYELWAPHPMVPFRTMGHRYILAPLAVAMMLDFIWEMQGDYLYYMLQVTYNFGVSGATRVSSLYSFCSVITGVITGLVIYFTRRVKIFIIFGVCLFMVAFGILIRFRGHPNEKSGLIGGEVVLGIAGGLFPYPTQMVIQAFVTHENLGVITGLYLALYNIGAALGTSVSGAVYTQLLPRHLEKNLQTTNTTILANAFGSPLTFILEYPIGTAVRAGMIEAYREIQRIMLIIGICLIVLLLAAALILPNPILIEQRSLVEDDRDVSVEDKGKLLTKLTNALSMPPKKRVVSENRSKWQRFVDELW